MALLVKKFDTKDEGIQFKQRLIEKYPQIKKCLTEVSKIIDSSSNNQYGLWCNIKSYKSIFGYQTLDISGI